MTKQPQQPHQTTQLAKQALETVKLLRLCHTLEDCTAQDREQALMLIQAYLDRIVEEAELHAVAL